MIFDFSQLNEEQRKFVAKLDSMGEAAVAATVVSDIWKAHRTLAIAWLEFKKKERELQAWHAAMDAAKASETTAKVAEGSMQAAARSAYWTKWAAVATAIAAIGTCVQAYLQYGGPQTKISDATVQSQVQGHSAPDQYGTAPGRVGVGTAGPR